MKKHKSIVETEPGTCYLCLVAGRTISNDLEEHHIMHGTANRQVSDRYGLTVHLCRFHHRNGPCAVHRNRLTDLNLIRTAQSRFEELWGHDEWMKVFMKNYL